MWLPKQLFNFGELHFQAAPCLLCCRAQVLPAEGHTADTPAISHEQHFALALRIRSCLCSGAQCDRGNLNL